MRRLILFRHGKAVPHESGSDFERGLTARGQRDSAAMGAYLASEGLLPELVLVSPAERTRGTWDAVKSAFPEPVRDHSDQVYYLATADELLRAVQVLSDTLMTVMVIGHNPSLHDLALELAGYGDRYALARLREEMPTAGVVVLDCMIDHWSDLAPRSARLERFRTPVGDGVE